MAYYKNETEKVEAFQLNEKEVYRIDWFWKAVEKNIVAIHNLADNEPIWCEIRTINGILTAREGDYIVRNAEKDIFLCEKDVFERNYQKIEVKEI